MGVCRAETPQALLWHINVASILEKYKILLRLKISKPPKSI